MDLDGVSETTGTETARLRRMAVIVVTAFFVADGLLRTLYVYFGRRAVGFDPAFRDSLGSEVTGSLATATVFFLVVIPASRRWPLMGPGWARRLPAHLLALLAFSVTKTFLMWAMRVPLWPLLGLGAYDYGNLLFRFPMEGAGDVIGYVTLSAAVHVWYAWQRSRERELRTARLESQLVTARLSALQDRLQPHFLFNTLNTIGALIHEDPEAADRMITRLSDLLRRALEATGEALVTVREEIAFLSEYLAIMMVRFEDRARVELAVDERVSQALIPPLILQPLAENAFKHGVEARADAGSVRVSVRRDGGSLEVTVTDDGPGEGAPPIPAGPGVGLSSVQDRLSLLFGPQGTLDLMEQPGGGAVATVRLPLRFASARPETEPAP